jgi:predicted phosphodiesterase
MQNHLTRIVLPDTHFPFQDDPLLNSWLSHLSDLKPDGVDIIGDLVDCYTLSRFDRNPARKASFQDEIDKTWKFLGCIRELAGVKCDIRYSEGNHESRLRKILWKKIPELAGLRNLTIPRLLGLKKLGIKWHGTQNPYPIRDLWFTHGDLLRKHAGMSARAKSDDSHCSLIVGHTHRMGWSPRTTWTGIEDAYEVGYLADYKQLDYVHTVPNWQQGWAVVEFPPEGGHYVNFVKVVVVKGKRLVMYKGKVIDKL